MGRKRKKTPIKLELKPETNYSIAAVCSILVGLLIMVSFSGQGEVLLVINTFLRQKLGWSMLFLPFVFFASGLAMLRSSWQFAKPNVLLGTLILLLASLLGFKTGQIGQQTVANLAALITPAGVYITAICLAVIGLLVMIQSSLVELAEGLSQWWASRAEAKLDRQVDKLKAQNSPLNKKNSGFSIPKINLFASNKPQFNVNQTDLHQQGIGDATTGTAVNLPPATKPTEPAGSESSLDNETLTPSNLPMIWEYPPLSLLADVKGGQADRGDVNQNAQIIEDSLESFGIKADVKEVNYGPSVTQYALEVSRGTKLSKITSLATDLAMSLAAPTGQIRIEAPIAGRSLVGIEVPNHSPEYVSLKTMLGSSKLKNHPSKLAVGLGIDVSGQPVLADISAMPHLLIAGATGSGKSVCINSFLTSLLFRASPSELRLILVDPKRVELTGYNGIPHLLTPVIVEANQVVSALKWTVNLMEKRYKQLAEVGVRHIQAYNELAGLAAMPNVVVVIDEMADVMLFAPGDVEESVTRIAQMARAVGIHLILATQRPSVDVLTGLIKANVPARIAFSVSSMTDSRVILDSPGAEKLLGSGDMLFLSPDKAKPVRVQGTYVSSKEIKNLIDFLKSKGQKPQYEEEITTKYQATKIGGGSSSGIDGDGKDELFDEAARLFANADTASSSLIQRRLSVGYARAARILDQLYEAGLVGPPQGSKPREINIQAISSYLASKSQG